MQMPVPRVVSVIVLLGIVLLVGAMFFEVMLQFVVPLFLASVLIVIFKPLHEWVIQHVTPRPRIAAGITTALVLLTVLAPTLWLSWNAYREAQGVFDFMEDDANRTELINRLSNRAEKFRDRYERLVDGQLDVKKIAENASQIVASALLRAVRAVLGFLIGAVIMMLAVYYFLADGPAMVGTLMRLSPLDDRYEAALLDKFADSSRSVVLATGMSAVVQGILAGIGYYFACPADAPIFLLTAATMLFAIVPFVGATAVWLPTCLLLYFYVGDTAAAIVLAIYCVSIVSMADNVIKPLVLHGKANLHPLIALLSVLGGAQALGPIGIIVGPMLVAFLQALLEMLNEELSRMGDESGEMVGAPAVALPSKEPSTVANGGTSGRSKRGKGKKKKT